MEKNKSDYVLIEMLRSCYNIIHINVVYNDQNEAIILIIANEGILEVPVELGQLINLQELDLHGNLLTQIPKELGQLNRLQKMYLHRNQLRQIPRELGSLGRLQKLYLSGNLLAQVPEELGLLVSLQELYLNSNRLVQVPGELGQLSSLQELYLSGNQLTQIPVDLGKLSSLLELDVSENQLTQVPKELGLLDNLQSLYLHRNQLMLLPEELGRLAHLQRLYLGENQLTQVPKELGQLHNLQELYLHRNRLRQIPVELAQLQNVQKLYLQRNQFTQIPVELGKLNNLRKLYLSENQLMQVPAELGLVSELQEMDLSGNQLTRVPEDFGQLRSLKRLDLRGNQLRQIPKELRQLSNLQELYLNGNQLTQLPVELGQLGNLQILDLRENQLVQVPGELGQLGSLRVLNLRGNRLMQVPGELGQLGSLQVLNLRGNRLMQVPGELGQLANLQELDLSGNCLVQVPKELGQLSHLQMLNLSENRLTLVPKELGQLSNLQLLDLHKNELTQVPKELGQLGSLQTLYLNGNHLTRVPRELGQPGNLQKLNLSENQLRQVPRELGQLGSLQELDLSENWLRQVPKELGEPGNLQKLDLSENPQLLTPPPEIVSQGTQAILAFLRELHQKYVTRYEAKLILVGEGGTGKSSLLRALHDRAFDASLQTTHGIEVEALTLPCPLQPECLLTLNTWDFGGQQIYHATHQFFLTKRSLYLVAWNARLGGEQGRLDYWLSTIRALAPDAPVLLVATHIDERAPDLNVPQYCKDYPQIVEVLNISNKTNAGIEELKRQVAWYAARLPLMGQPWPGSWIKVEQQLVMNPDHHISATAYIELCFADGVQAALAQGTLGNYLHDLGKILYFRDDPILSNLVILKPNWVTKAISFVLEDEETRKRQGILDHKELARIWAVSEQGQPYSPTLYPVFLRLMEHFDLCYQIAPEWSDQPVTKSLIPQLLPYHPPSSLPTWSAEDMKAGKGQVEMVYRLDFVPSGIMSWFIVRSHRYTNHLHWREGAVLVYDGHIARVELFPRRKELHMNVWGVEPRTFLVILKETIDLILSRFGGLKIKREVPCICRQLTGVTQPCPEFYDYDKQLIKRLNQGIETVQCNESFCEVKVRDLLFGLHISTVPQVQAVIADSKRILRILDEVQSKEDLLLQQNQLALERINKLAEWQVRQFTRLWNWEMQRIESECPNTFMLIPNTQTIFNPKSWISYDYKLFLMCQYPAGPHCIASSVGYDVRQSKKWWVTILPWLRHLIAFLKYGVPLAGAALQVALSEDLYKRSNKQVELLERIIEDIVDLNGKDTLDLAEAEGADANNWKQSSGGALRVLRSFLKSVDPGEYWDGLRRVITEDGNIFWLCPEHAHPYRVWPLQIDAS